MVMAQDAGLQGKVLVAKRPVFNARAWPGNVAITQQRHQVVGDRPDHGILKIEYSGVIPASQHEVT